MWESIIKGGPIMAPIILCSIIAFAVFIERIWYLRSAKIDTGNFMKDVTYKVRSNRVMEAVDMCNSTKGPIAHIIKSGIMKYDKPREYEEMVAQGKLDDYIVEPIPAATERGFRIFGFIALAIGLSLIGLIIYAMTFGYR